MLSRLSICNYALIEALESRFPEHLVIITGETGAGKSILLGALSLLMGQKVDASVISDKEKNCVVEGEFFYEGESYIIRRVIAPSGRSRSFVNDEPVTVDYLKELSSKLIDVHTQNQHLMLSDYQYQLELLDSYCSNGKLLAKYQSYYADYQSVMAKIESVERDIVKAENEREFAQFQYSQLEGASLREGELEELEQEQKLLSNSEEIKENLQGVLSKFTSEPFSLVQLLKESENLLKKSSNYLPQAESLYERVESCRLELKDIEQEVDYLCDSVEYSPERLQYLDDRISLIYNLLRKFGKSDESELIALRDSLKATVSGAEELLELKETLLKQSQELLQNAKEIASQLHLSRLEGASKLSEELLESVRDLSMPHALFSISLQERERLDINGADDIKFLFSANGGSLMELHKCASGGEVSRLMLSLKAIMAKHRGMPTMIFDEIDTGVSGVVADQMGKLITSMGENMQVMAITHLPQIASKGESHFLVTKSFNADGKAVTNISQLSEDERVNEIARMLSGEVINDAAIANAKVLLNSR